MSVNPYGGPHPDAPGGRERRLAYPESEAAELIGVSVRTLFNLREQNRIAFVRLGARVLYRASALRQFLRDNETPTHAPAGIAARSPTNRYAPSAIAAGAHDSEQIVRHPSNPARPP
jgi:excisionase family DNA binding protein